MIKITTQLAVSVASNELLADEAYDVVGWLTRIFGEAVGQELDYTLIVQDKSLSSGETYGETYGNAALKAVRKPAERPTTDITLSLKDMGSCEVL